MFDSSAALNVGNFELQKRMVIVMTHQAHMCRDKPGVGEPEWEDTIVPHHHSIAF